MSSQYDHVSILKKANIFHDGKCISHTVIFPDGEKKTLGVIMPSRQVFSCDQPEIIEIVAGKCRVRVEGEEKATIYNDGQRFHVPAASHFEIEALEPVHYVCHIGKY